MDDLSKKVSKLSLISGLMILSAIILNRVDSGVYLELLQGFLLGLSVVISFRALHIFATKPKVVE